MHGTFKLFELIVTIGAGDPDLVSWVGAHSDNVLPLLPSQRSPEASKAALQLLLGLIVSFGAGDPEVANSDLASLTTVVPLSPHRLLAGSNARPPTPTEIVTVARRAEVLAYRGEAEAVALMTRAVSMVSASGDSFFVANYDLGRGRILISQGQEDDGYQVLEEAITKLESFGSLPCAWRTAPFSPRSPSGGVTCSRRGAISTHRAGGCREQSSRQARRCSGLKLAWHGPKACQSAAHGLACDGLAAALEGGYVLRVVELLELVAITCSDLGTPADAARLLGAAVSQRDFIGYVRPAAARNELAPVLADLQATLGHAAFEAALSEGGALSLEEAVAYARRGRGKHNRARSGWDSLTPSEQQVASLVGQHLTNAQIAERLFISVPTVKSHLNRAFAKLGMNNRGQLAAGAHCIEAPRVP